MKVSFFTPLNDQGISTYSRRILDAMRFEKGVSISLVGLKKIFLINFNPVKYFNSFFIYRRLGKEMNNADIAHIQHEYTLFCQWMNPFENRYEVFRRQIKIPTVITVHEIIYKKFPSGNKLKLFLKKFYFYIFSNYWKYITVKIFDECDAVIVHTKKSKDILIQRGVHENKINIIPIGVPSVEKSTKTIAQDKEKLGLKNKFVLTTFGFISERKGQDLVIDIMDKLPPDVVYVIAGGIGLEKVFSDYYKLLKQKVKDKGLEERVIFTDFIEQKFVKTLMNATDIIIAPMREITGSASILEAIAYNKFIIASDIDFMRDINSHNECLCLFESENKHELLISINKYMKTPSDMLKYVDQTEIYSKSFNYSSVAKSTIDIYKSVLDL